MPSLIATAAMPARLRNKLEVTEEFERVFYNLPRRADISDVEIAQISAYLRQNPGTDVCQLCHGVGVYQGSNCLACGCTGRVMLRAPQAQALREAFELRGGFFPMRVGGGKTLVTLLAATLLDVEQHRSVLCVPANLREKTRRDYADLLINWRVRLPKIVSYSLLSQPDREHLLFELQPKLLILDEAHKTRDTGTTTARVVKRYIDAMAPVVISLSGTMLGAKIMKYHHIMVQSLGINAPVPRPAAEAEQWGKALEALGNHRSRFDPGPLASVNFGENLRGSRGIVITPGSDVDCSLEMRSWAPKIRAETLALIDHVEETKLRPDGEMLGDFEVADCVSQLALGFFYVWDPLPPEWWLQPRRAWYAYKRAVLDEHLEGFDCPTHIYNALDHGPRTTLSGDKVMPPAYEEGRMLLAAWREVKERYKPTTKAIWVDSDPMQSVADCKPGTLIWVKYTEAGEALQHMGIPYYPGGTQPDTAAKPGSTIALMRASHMEGKNFQHHWHRNRVTTPPANADAWEQLLGRTHRSGQKADAVICEYYDGPAVDYFSRVMNRVQTEAREDSQEAGFQAKLLDATWC